MTTPIKKTNPHKRELAWKQKSPMRGPSKPRIGDAVFLGVPEVNRKDAAGGISAAIGR